MKKKIIDAFYAFEEERKKEGIKGTAAITIPMAIINNMIHARGKPIYDEHDLTQAEIDMLITLHVHNDGITAAEVSDRMVFSSGGISKVVKKLELKKLISRKDSLEDKRSSLIYLEDKGRELALKCMPQFGKNDEYFYSVLNETEKEILEKAFKKILYSIAEQ